MDLSTTSIKSQETELCIKWHCEKNKDAPHLKNHASICYGENIILFGGFDGYQNVNSVNIYNINSKSWKSIQTYGDQPKARNGHSATLVDNNLYIIGGWLGSGSSASDEIYELNLLTYTWKKIILEDGQSIGACNMHTADYYKNKIVVFRGGNGRSYLNDLFAIYLGEKKFTKNLETIGRAPSPRANHGSCLVNNILYIFGGWNGSNRLNDFFCINLDTLTWSNISYSKHIKTSSNFFLNNENLDNRLGARTIPQTLVSTNSKEKLEKFYSSTKNYPRKRAGMPLLNYKNEYLILFGGSAINSVYLNDLFFYDLKQNVWTKPDSVINLDNWPKERAGHSAIVNDRFIYIYGGGTQGNVYYSEMNFMEIDPPPDFSKFKIQKLSNSYQIISSFKDYYNSSLLSDVIIKIHDEIIYGHQIVLSLLSETLRELFISQKSSNDLNISRSRIGDEYVNYTSFISDVSNLNLKILNSNLGTLNSNNNYTDDSISDFIYKPSTSNIMSSSSNHEYFILEIKNFKPEYTKKIIKYLYFGEIEFDNKKDLNLDELTIYLSISCKLKIEDLKYMIEIKIIKIINFNNYEDIRKIAIDNNADNLLDYCNWFYRQNKQILNKILNK
jgi:leucine-zipper-like transcriptional regulator 1